MEHVLNFINPDDGWLTEILALFLIPYLHEDVAIFGAAFLIVDGGMPARAAVVSLYIGIVTSDMALYGLGLLAHHNSWAQRLMLKPGIASLAGWLGNHLAPLMVLARIIPGVMFPVYLSLGFCRVSFFRFALITMVTAAVYLPIVLLLIAKFGQQVLTPLGFWSWILAISAVAATVWSWSRNPNWRVFFSGSEFGFGGIFRGPRSTTADLDLSTHNGMPKLGSLPTMVSLAERIPPALFYIPLAVQWIWLGLRHRSLSLPSLANPEIESGGLWGESKSAYLETVGVDQRKWLADFTTLRRSSNTNDLAADQERARQCIAAANLSFPLVGKPDIGWRGYGVRLIEDEVELEKYIEQFPEGATILFQRAIPWDGEAGVLYARTPDQTDGHIFSLTFRYFPHVVGDGQSPLRDLVVGDQRAIWKVGAHLGLDPKHLGAVPKQFNRVPNKDEIVRLSFVGSNRVGGLYRDAREHITPALVRRFDAISKSIPEFYYGRFDVKFLSVERLEQGEDIQIIEVNGAGGESINVWDPEMPLAQVYKELFAQQRLLFEIGALNRTRGFRPPGLLSIAKSQWHQHRLIVHYPPSN